MGLDRDFCHVDLEPRKLVICGICGVAGGTPLPMDSMDAEKWTQKRNWADMLSLDQ